MTTSNNDKRVLNVPPLRFPDFKGEWEKDKASALLECFPTNSITWEDLNFGGGTMRDLHYGLIHKGFNKSVMPADSKLIPWINSGKEPKKYTKIKDGDLILADASEDTNECGKPVELFGCLNSDVVSGLHTIHCRDKKNFSVPGFKAYLFQSGGIKKQLYRLCEGTKIYSISPSTLDEVILHFPVKKEQQRIVDFLNSLEDRILLQRKIIEEYTKQMSSLFAFLNSGAKELHFFSEIGPLAKTDSLSWGDISCEGKNKCILYGELFTKYHYQVSKAVSKTNAESKNASEGNELLFPSSTTVDAVSLISPCALNEAGVIMGGDLFAIRVCSKFNALYLSFLFNCIYKNRLAKYAQGTTIIHLHYDDIKNFRFQSVSLDKQNKICEIMEDELEKIDVEQKELRAIKNVKTHLLKNLFI